MGNEKPSKSEEQENIEDHPYWMKIDLRILNHLGINLYSNVAAVLSEAVANAWDADATEVLIDLAQDKIVIKDNGFGMGQEQVNDRFLNVGYDKRTHEGDVSPKGRSHMGRKGIGKLSLFSVAEVVEVYTNNGSESHVFKMELSKIKEAIKAGKTYYPQPIPFDSVEPGTRIVLTSLKTKRTNRTAQALRKRIARRFSIIGYKKEDDSFEVKIDGSPVTSDDREDIKTLEFLWEFGDEQKIPNKDLKSIRKRELISGVVNGESGWVVSGWIGAVPKPNQLSSIDAGALNNIVVLSRGRLIQENVLDKINYSRIFTKYLTGQIDADFLDLTDEDDIATSDRQRLIEDDDRYKALLGFVRQKLLDIDDVWTQWRNEQRGKDAIEDIPALSEWIDELPPGQKGPAKRLLGLVRSVDLDDESQRSELYKAGIVAFERLRLRESAHCLGESSELSAAKLLPLLSDLSMLEGSLYRDIVVSRLDVIKKLEKLVDLKEKEKLIQQHIFEKMWLLDPAWERATESERIEKKLKSDFKDFSHGLTEEESKGRYDIRYRTNGGLHILVELKKVERKLHAYELLEQGQKYVAALKKCLAETGEENPQVSIVFVLGKRVYEEENSALGLKYVQETLKPLGARVVYYEQLIKGAEASYAEFLERSKEADKLGELVKKIEKAATSST